MPRLTQEQITAKLNAARQALGGTPGSWTHRKSGTPYAVAGVGLTADDNPQVLVRYRRIDGSRQAQLVDWYRPLGEFLEKFDRRCRHAKMFLVFAHDAFYPGGGSTDFIGAYTTLEEAEAAAADVPGEFAEIYDATTETWSRVR